MNIFFRTCIGVVSIFLITACGEQKKETGNTTIKGQLSNSEEETILLEDLNSKSFTIIDSAKIDHDGNFLLSLNTTEPGAYNVKINSRNFATIVIGPNETLTISGDAKDLGNTHKVSGSQQALWFWELNDFSKQSAIKKSRIKNSLDSIQNYAQYLITKNNNSKFLDSLNKAIGPQYEALNEKLKASLLESEAHAKNFIDKNPSAFAAIIALNMINPETNIEYYQKVDENLKKTFPNSKNLQPFHSYINALVEKSNQLKIGSQAPDFTVLEPNGKEISLTSFKGKYVLVDFWASWCGPCRAENPNIVNAYKKYQSKGLEIFGVSLDEDKAKWTQAIMKDNLTWHHGSELKSWQSSFVPLYNLESIPMNFLIGPEGEIIAKNLRGDELLQTLEKLFQQKN